MHVRALNGSQGVRESFRYQRFSSLDCIACHYTKVKANPEWHNMYYELLGRAKQAGLLAVTNYQVLAGISILNIKLSPFNAKC
jgi:hypothetical protein